MIPAARMLQGLSCVLVLCCALKPSSALNPHVCMGTTNALSTTGNPDIQFNSMKERYSGCEVVMGNLEIVGMEHHRDLSFLQSIREVTGYVLVAVSEFSRLPLDQLRVIRGSSLFENYALAIMLNYKKDGHRGLQELGLTHLTEILEGGVMITRNRNLSYAPQVNWLDIVKDGNANIMIKGNGPNKPCDKACDDAPCWGPGSNKCQFLTKTVCAPQCNGRCFGRSPTQCCHNECAGGCSGPLDTDCFVCRRFNNSGSCVRECPQALLYNKKTFRMEANPNAKYQFGSICVTQCLPNHMVFGSSCVANCPPGTTEVMKNGEKRCQPCAGPCLKECRGTGSPDRQTVDAFNIDSFINCTKIQGSLHFLVTGIKGDDFNKVPPLDPDKLKIFNTVREITDILSIQSWPENMSDLSVFSNLETIEGRRPYKLMKNERSYSLMVMKIPSLTSLGLRSLRRIDDGSVYITGNKKLCYHHTLNWTKIFSSNVKMQKQMDIKSNCPKKSCVAQGHVCDPLCSDGCWGPGPDQCVSCRNYSRGGICVSGCMFQSGEQREFASSSGDCLLCHSECKVQEGKKTCFGPGADQCVSCANFQDGPHCVPSCPQGLMAGEGVIFKYPNKAGSCEPCHSNCTQGCSGPGLKDCIGMASLNITAIVLGVFALLFVSFSVFVLTVLYRRGLAIRRKRAMRRYMENGERYEPMDPGEKGPKVCARILKPSDIRKIKPLGNGVFGTVHKGVWTPEGDTVKLPVAIKTIHDRTGRQTFFEITDHMLAMGSLDHINVVRILGICPGASLQLVTQLSSQGSLLEHVRKHKNKLTPQRLLNWCVQIAKGMYYLEENRMVHRNLAARNILLRNNYTAQISDYGVADLLFPDDKKYFYNEAKAPIKWMALESILFRRYTHQSDVWSYGVTIWEMMSYGMEPYTNMSSQEVPDLLEKGERLSQPQICTIDVYMVMVKCWMIDENIRPTFKELASEFTRMARDPPRYLVIKEDCSQPDFVPDEQAQRSVDLDELEELDFPLDPEEELDEVSVAVPQYLPQYQSRSLSRLSRLDSHRVQIPTAGETGYLPMTPGVDAVGQSMLPSRSRLNSTRTVSESSECAGATVELDLGEDLAVGGGRRLTEDSAYMSQRDGLSGGPPGTPSPELDEEDQNGYVMPKESPERDMLLSPPRLSFKSIRNYPSAPLLDDPEDVEYEYMNRQRSPASRRDSNQRSKPAGSKKRTSSLSSYATTSSGDITPTPENRGSFNLEQFGAGEVQYEYMDIRGSSDSPPAHDPPPVPSKNESGEDEYVEDYQYTNRQPKLHRALQDRSQLRTQGGEEEQYEDMDSYTVMRSGEAAVYQNLESESGKTEAKRCGFEAYLKVRSGVRISGDMASADRSFDNPDYWHSRTHLKTNAVPT